MHVAGDRNHPGRFGLTFQPVYRYAQGIPGAEFSVAGQAIVLQQSLLCGLLGKQCLGYARNRITLAQGVNPLRGIVPLLAAGYCRTPCD